MTEAVDKNLEKCNMSFLLLFVGVKSGIPSERHLEPKQIMVYQTFLFSVKIISFEKNKFVQILSQICMHTVTYIRLFK